MATSPIYNWPEPDNTDLVKNGALAIRTLGNAIDTTMGTMVAKTVVDAKGDLIAGTAADTVNRLAVGNNGETLVADSSTSTGLRYQGNFAAGKNEIINGDFNIWQRGTTFTNPSAGTFTADRYSWDSVSMTGSITRQAFTPGTAPVAGYEGTFFARLDITSGTQFGELVQKIENGRTNAGQTVTASFWARLNSGASGWQVNVVQNFGTGGSPSSAVLAGQTSFTPTASWQRFTFTVAVPSVAGKTFGTNNNSFLAMTIQKTSSTASQLDTWGWQLEVGNTATAFQTATGTIQGELAACQRYYEKSYDQATAPATANIAAGLCMFSITSTVQAAKYGFVKFAVTKRVAPTVTVYGYQGGAGKVSTDSTGADQAANSGNVSAIGQGSFMVGNASGSTVTTSGGTGCHFVAEAEL